MQVIRTNRISNALYPVRPTLLDLPQPLMHQASRRCRKSCWARTAATAVATRIWRRRKMDPIQCIPRSSAADEERMRIVANKSVGQICSPRQSEAMRSKRSHNDLSSAPSEVMNHLWTLRMSIIRPLGATCVSQVPSKCRTVYRRNAQLSSDESCLF